VQYEKPLANCTKFSSPRHPAPPATTFSSRSPPQWPPGGGGSPGCEAQKRLWFFITTLMGSWSSALGLPAVVSSSARQRVSSSAAAGVARQNMTPELNWCGLQLPGSSSPSS